MRTLYVLLSTLLALATPVAAQVVGQGAPGSQPWPVTSNSPADVTVSDTVNSLNDAATLALQGLQSGGFVITGTAVLTLNVEVSRDGGTTWINGDVFDDQLDTSAQTVVYTGADTRHGSFILRGGETHVRFRANPYTSGSLTVGLRATSGRAPMSLSEAAWGTNLPRAVTVIAGKDTTNQFSEIPAVASSDPAGGTFGLVVRNIPSGTQTISGTVTANAGTNLNTSALALDATVTGRWPAGASPADNESNTNANLSRVGSFAFVFDGSTWDRWTGAVSATQSGSWSVSQTGTWSVRAQDGSGNNLTSKAAGSERAITVAVVDSSGNQISSFGGSGGTAQNDNTALGQITGIGALFDTTPPSITDGNVGIPRMNSSRQLQVDCVAGCSGSSFADNSAFTFGTTAIGLSGGVLDDTSPNAATENSAALARISANRNWYFQLRDGAGNERGANVNASNQLSVSVDNTPTVTANAGTNLNTSALALDATLTGRLPAGASPADNESNTNTSLSRIGTFNFVFDGTTWDRWTGGVTQSGTWNINNISGTVSLPTGASTLAEQQTQTTALQLIDDTVHASDAALNKVSAVGAQLDDTSPGTTTENNVRPLRMSTRRELYSQIRDAAGNERGVNVTAGNALVVDGSAVTQPVSGTVTVGTFPDNEPFNLAQVNGGTVTTVATGTQKVGVADDGGNAIPSATAGPATTARGLNIRPVHDDPCETKLTTHLPISVTTNTQLVAGVSSQHVYICSINLVAGAATNVAIVAGTGSVCATGIAGVFGGSTAATGWNFAANGGIAFGNGARMVGRTVDAADALCILVSAANQVSGSITYVQQ